MNAALRVWLVDDDASIRWVLERALRNDGMAPRAFEAAEPALEALRRESPDVLITDIRMPGASGLELLRRIRDARPALPVIVMTAHSDLGSAVSAYEGGAFEYLPKPFDIDQAVALVRRAANGAAPGSGDAAGTPRIPELLGRAPAMQQVFRAIGRLARSSVTVLITGESGTGKELVARALHEHSPRAGKPFIALNTSAIPAELLESELFGHEKRRVHRRGHAAPRPLRAGRRRHAVPRRDRRHVDCRCRRGCLRVLAEGEFYRVGGQTPIRVDVRVIAATHQNLEDRVARGLFREDLYHRLNVIRIELPPLRARARGHSGPARALHAGRGARARRRAEGARARGAGDVCAASRLAGQRARARQPVPAALGARARKRGAPGGSAAGAHAAPSRRTEACGLGDGAGRLGRARTLRTAGGRCSMRRCRSSSAC